MRSYARLSTVAVSLSLLLFLSCPNPTATQPAAPPEEERTQATLADYKISAVGARTDNEGNILPPNAQPFGAAVATPLLRQQVYVGGPTYQGATSNLIGFSGNVAKTLRQLPDATKTSWTKYPHATVGARLGSGAQTIVSAVFIPTSPAVDYISTNQKTTGTLQLVTWDGSTQSILTPLKSGGSDQPFDVYMLGWAGAGYSALSMAAGDVDDDGKDELALCVGNRFIVLDHDLSTLLHDSWATADGAANTNVGTFHPSIVAAGDIMNDGSTAFVVAYGTNETGTVGTYKVYSGAKPAEVASGALTTGSVSLNYANIAFGDIDGDGLQEILFAGLGTGGACRLLAANWNAAQKNMGWKAHSYDVPGMQATFWMDHPMAPLVAFNPDGKAKEARDIVMVWNNVVKYDKTAGFSQGYGDLTTIDVPLLTNAVAADINYDNQDELITLPVSGNNMNVYSMNASGRFEPPASIALTNSPPSSVLAVADVTGESLSLEYVSQAVRYANPKVVAVLASPPYYAGAESSGSFGNGSTTLGFTNETSNDLNTAMTVSAGVTFGSDVEVPLLGSDAGAARDTLTIEASFTFGFSKTKTQSCTHEYTTMAGQDAVIYSCVPYDVYSYRVLSAPNAASIGSVITIEFPRKPQVMMMDKDAFNALPGNPVEIGASVFTHTLGKPRTYPSKATMSAACMASDTSMYDKTEGMKASQGENYTTDTISYGMAKATSLGVGASVTYEAEAVVAGVVFGVSIGLSSDTTYTVSTGTSTEISGTVPSIVPSEPGFSYGIGMYRYNNKEVQDNPFLVVTYWVEN